MDYTDPEFEVDFNSWTDSIQGPTYDSVPANLSPEGAELLMYENDWQFINNDIWASDAYVIY